MQGSYKQACSKANISGEGRGLELSKLAKLSYCKHLELELDTFQL